MSKGPEAILQAKVMDLARLYGWHRAHFRVAYMPGRDRWVTPMSGETGFPDLVLVKPPRLIFAELKSKVGRLSPPQKEWLFLLAQTNTETYVWRPADLDQIRLLLSDTPPTTDDESYWRRDRDAGGPTVGSPS